MMINKFDKTAFAYLLKKALGPKTQVEFAEECGISTAHFSRLINEKFDKPPTLDTVALIASHTTFVSDFELYIAAGYGIDKSEDGLPSAREIQIFKLIHATLLSSLGKFNSPWTVEKNLSDLNSGMSICINGPVPFHWQFFYMEHMTEVAAKHYLQQYYSELIFRDLKPDDKFSFVTSSPQEYKIYNERLPRNLFLNLSIILIDTDNLNIIEESLLQSNGMITQDDLSHYAF